MNFKGINISIREYKVEESVEKLTQGFYKQERKIQIEFMVEKTKNKIMIRIEKDHKRRGKTKKEIKNLNDPRSDLQMLLFFHPNNILLLFQLAGNHNYNNNQMGLTLKKLLMFCFFVLNVLSQTRGQNNTAQYKNQNRLKDQNIYFQEQEITQQKVSNQTAQSNRKLQSSGLNIADSFIKKNQDYSGVSEDCIYNLNYLDGNRSRLLSQDKMSQDKGDQEQRILKQFDYQAYLRRFKPKQLFEMNFQQDNFQYRLRNFIQNCKKILQHNLQQGVSYLKGLNQFTDISDLQFYKLYTSPLFIKPMKVIQKEEKAIRNLQALRKQQQLISLRYTTHIDWRCKCRQIFNQKSCNSCYAFATIDSIQISLRILNKQKEYLLSTQQIISCAKDKYKSSGCNGGYPDDVYYYINKKGVGSALLYPLNSQTIDFGNQTQCNKSLIDSQQYKKSKIFIKGYKEIRRGDCQQVVRILKTQVLIVSIYGDGLRSYKSGTFVPAYRQNNPGHGVTLVGYHPKHKYLIKNSWGPKWGLNGYAYVSENSGVCKYSFYPIL